MRTTFPKRGVLTGGGFATSSDFVGGIEVGLQWSDMTAAVRMDEAL
ncbi:MAG: hypothetical protein INR71_13090 [Terriglobus roseus]|nr:hypothetical protein [Terriglobus roseus]